MIGWPITPKKTPRFNMETKPIKDFQACVQKIENLHGNMAVLSRLGPMLKDPNSSLDDAARLIQSDSALTASIIHISNSAFYLGSQRVNTVSAALGKVGFNQALKLVGMALSKQVFMKDLDVYGISADTYWCSSYFAGLFLEESAGQLGFDRDDAYMVGLLHGIGKVVLNELLQPEDVEIFWDPSFPSNEWEEIMFGLHQEDAGAYLLEQWKFPEAIYRRVRDQLSTSAQAEDRLLGGLAYISEVMNQNHLDFDRIDWEIPEAHPFYARTKSKPEEIRSAIKRTREGLNQARKTIAQEAPQRPASAR